MRLGASRSRREWRQARSDDRATGSGPAGRRTACAGVLALHEQQEDVVGLVQRQRGIDALDEGDHGALRGAAPASIDVAVVAADALQLALDLADEGDALGAVRKAGCLGVGRAQRVGGGNHGAAPGRERYVSRCRSGRDCRRQSGKLTRQEGQNFRAGAGVLRGGREPISGREARQAAEGAAVDDVGRGASDLSIAGVEDGRERPRLRLPGKKACAASTRPIKNTA